VKFRKLSICKTSQIIYQKHLLIIRVSQKSHNPAANVPERVEIPTQELPNQNKRGRGTSNKG
jgi:hypothetical protein